MMKSSTGRPQVSGHPFVGFATVVPSLAILPDLMAGLDESMWSLIGIQAPTAAEYSCLRPQTHFPIRPAHSFWCGRSQAGQRLLTAVDVSRSACQRRVFRRAVNCLCLCTGCRPGTGAYCPGERQASACRWQIEATQGNFLRGCEENTVIPGPRTDMADRHFPGNRPISDKSGACPDRLVEQPSPSVPVNSAVRAVLSSWS